MKRLVITVDLGEQVADWCDHNADTAARLVISGRLNADVIVAAGWETRADAVKQAETRSRRNDPETSADAARALDPDKLRDRHAAVLDTYLRYGPLADRQLALHYEGPQQSDSGLRTRRSELAEIGLVEFSGDYYTNPSGRRARIWQLTQAGNHVARAALGATTDGALF